MTDYLTTDTELTSVANAIRTKGGTSAALEWPTEYVSAIDAIPTGGGSVELASVTMPYSVTYYVDATMTPQTGSTIIGVQMPIGSICVGQGVAEPGSTASGVALMATWGSRTSATHVYKVTG